MSFRVLSVTGGRKVGSQVERDERIYHCDKVGMVGYYVVLNTTQMEGDYVPQETPMQSVTQQGVIVDETVIGFDTATKTTPASDALKLPMPH